MMRGPAWGLALLAIVSTGCAGTETGNPSFEGELAYDAFTSDVTRVALRSSGASEPGATVVDAAWLVLGDIGFARECGTPVDQAAVHATGIGEGDHAAQGRVVTALALEAGNYCGASVPLVRAAQAIAGPPELNGHSILILGTTPDGRSFRVATRSEGALQLTGSVPFEISETSATVLIGFDLAVWLDAIDWTQVEEASGLITVDEAHNVALLGAFEAALARGTGLYRSDATAPIDSAHPLARGE